MHLRLAINILTNKIAYSRAALIGTRLPFSMRMGSLLPAKKGFQSKASGRMVQLQLIPPVRKHEQLSSKQPTGCSTTVKGNIAITKQDPARSNPGSRASQMSSHGDAIIFRSSVPSTWLPACAVCRSGSSCGGGATTLATTFLPATSGAAGAGGNRARRRNIPAAFPAAVSRYRTWHGSFGCV